MLKKVNNDVLVNGKINCRKLVNLNVVFPVSNIIMTIFNIIIHVNLINLYVCKWCETIFFVKMTQFDYWVVFFLCYYINNTEMNLVND